MFEDIATIFNRSISKEKIAEVLNTTPEAIIEFEKAYSVISDEENKASGNFFKLNSRDAAKRVAVNDESIAEIEDRILCEILHTHGLLPDHETMPFVTNEEINSLPEELRPQLTRHLVKKIMDSDFYPILLEMYSAWKDTADMKHDYIIYCKEEKRLQSTFDANKERVCEHLRDLIPDIDLPGQCRLILCRMVMISG